MSDQISAPFSPSQIESFNKFQVSGVFHPFTCSTDGCDVNLLQAKEEHLFCPGCQHTQLWAWSEMLDFSWKNFEMPWMKDGL